MATPTSDKLRIYFASKYLTAESQPLTENTADAGGTVQTIVDSALTEAEDYWAGAIGWFAGDTTTAALRGQFFHVQSFAAATDTLTLSRELPAAPVAGDTYYLALGGKFRSTNEAFGMLVGGELPELATIVGTNITGLTIKKASALLGEETLSVFYEYATDLLYIKMGSEAYGVGVDVSVDKTDGIVFAADGQAFLQFDTVATSLPGSDKTDTWSLTYSERTFTPDYEGYETDNAFSGKTRYRLESIVNTDPADGMVGVAVYIGKPSGTASTIAAGSGIDLSADDLDVDDASDWPTRSFWIRNTTINDCRYVKYRSGNKLYCLGVDWGILNFDAGANELQQSDSILGNTSGATAFVDQVVVTSGTWGGSNAAGYLIIKGMSVADFLNDEDIKVGGTTMAAADGPSVRGLRGFTATSWVATEAVEVMADVDIGVDAPSTGEFEDPASETIAPDGVTFSAADSAGAAISLGDLAPSAEYGVWRREWIVDEHQSRAGIIADTYYSWS